MAAQDSTKEQIDMLCPCTKSYYVIRKPFGRETYYDDVSSIARWFYLTNNTDNITIITYGSFHETYPNPAHLTVEIQHDGMSTGRMHLSINADGYWYQQQLPGRGYGNKQKSRKYKRKYKKRKRKGKKSRRR